MIRHASMILATIPQPAGPALAAVCAVAAAAGAAVTFGLLRWRGRPARPSSRIQSELRLLQLEDTCGRLGEGWNQLIEQVTDTRRELEDVQIRRRAREALAQYELKWFTQLLNQIPCGLITVADEWLITFANPAAERLLGSPEGGLKGRYADEFFARDLSHVRPRAGIAIDQLTELRHAPALVRITTAGSMDDAVGSETALLLQDVTRERERERELSEFLYHVTHELRTPLTNIRAYAETLSEGVLKDAGTLRKCYNVIVGETQRLGRLVEDILSLAQMEAGAARPRMDDVDTARLVRQTVEDMQARADEKGLSLVLTMPAKVPDIRGDKERLVVLLTNVVGNAIKYTPSGGRVEVTCRREAARLHIRVADTGPGIAPGEHDKVFEKFYRSPDERIAQQPGTGLGLALAIQIARLHGGTITLESEPDNGSTFTVVLPIGNLAAVPS